jgi:hypothetical protein
VLLSEGCRASARRRSVGSRCATAPRRDELRRRRADATIDDVAALIAEMLSLDREATAG